MTVKMRADPTPQEAPHRQPGGVRWLQGTHAPWFFSVRSHSRGFGQSNSLPTAGSVGGGMGRRNPRQYQIPSRNVPSARLGLLGTSGFVSSTQRNTTANPTIMKQGRQVCSAPERRVGSPAQRPRLQDVSPDDPKVRGEAEGG